MKPGQKQSDMSQLSRAHHMYTTSISQAYQYFSNFPENPLSPLSSMNFLSQMDCKSVRWQVCDFQYTIVTRLHNFNNNDKIVIPHLFVWGNCLGHSSTKSDIPSRYFPFQRFARSLFALRIFWISFDIRCIYKCFPIIIMNEECCWETIFFSSEDEINDVFFCCIWKIVISITGHTLTSIML